MSGKFGVFLTAALLVALPAVAQENTVTVRVGGGLTGIYGTASNVFGNGWGSAGNLTAGVYVKATPLVSLGGEYGWNGLPTKTKTLTAFPTPYDTTNGIPAEFSFTGNMQYADFNAMVHPHVAGKVAPYFIGGVGAYYRPVTAASGATGYVTVCDPVLYICSETPTSVNGVAGTRSSTDVGMNVGGGLNVRLSQHVGAFFEARYHYIWGPSITQHNVPAGTQPASLKANGEFVPITFGIRF